MKLKCSVILLFLLASWYTIPIASGQASDPDQIVGVWMVPEKDARVEIYKDSTGHYNGKIVWLLEPYDEYGRPRKDIHNKDSERAKLELIGHHAILGFVFNEEKEKWHDGKVYNYRNGKTFAGFIKMQEDGTLLLRGHVKGLKFLGKTYIWESGTYP